MIARRSFVHLLVAVFALGVVAGFAAFILSGATTNTGTSSAIGSEYSRIVAAEQLSCLRFGTFGTVATLRRERVLDFQPAYNSVVFLPGSHCGSYVVGSSAYQSSGG